MKTQDLKRQWTDRQNLEEQALPEELTTDDLYGSAGYFVKTDLRAGQQCPLSTIFYPKTGSCLPSDGC